MSKIKTEQQRKEFNNKVFQTMVIEVARGVLDNIDFDVSVDGDKVTYTMELIPIGNSDLEKLIKALQANIY